MKALLLDTHCLIWLALDDRKLGRKSRDLIHRTLTRSTCWVSAISFWEFAQLALAGDITVTIELNKWRLAALSLGLRELPLTGEAAIRGAQAMPYHEDPFDRMIVGAALLADAELMTADSILLGWKGPLQRHNARD